MKRLALLSLLSFCFIAVFSFPVDTVHIPADTRSAFPLISVHSPVSIQYRWQS